MKILLSCFSINENPEIAFSSVQITGIPNTTATLGNVEFTFPFESK